jgi:hypothetical protein
MFAGRLPAEYAPEEFFGRKTLKRGCTKAAGITTPYKPYVATRCCAIAKNKKPPGKPGGHYG